MADFNAMFKRSFSSTYRALALLLCLSLPAQALALSVLACLSEDLQTLDVVHAAVSHHSLASQSADPDCHGVTVPIVQTDDQHDTNVLDELCLHCDSVCQQQKPFADVVTHSHSPIVTGHALTLYNNEPAAGFNRSLQRPPQ